MVTESGISPAASRLERVPPYSEEAERGALGSILIDAGRVMDLAVEQQLTASSFYVPAHRLLFEVLRDMQSRGAAVDLLTVTEQLRASEMLEKIGGASFLDRLVDSTPTAAHADYYIDLVRQKDVLRRVIDCARQAESKCYEAGNSADQVISQVEQDFFNITENQHGVMAAWPDVIKQTVGHIEKILDMRRGLTGVSTGFLNLDHKLQGLRAGEMIVLAARPSMGKTSLAMNIAENVALGKNDPDHQARPVGIFSLEMSAEQLAMRMMCSHARVSGFKLTTGYASATTDHNRLMQAADILGKAPIYLDDTGGLDIIELRARARRMAKKYRVQLVVIDYLQLLHSDEYARQGKQVETAHISWNLKAMAKELKVPVLVLSQLSRAPEQRDKTGKPKLSDLRDSGAIEQDADVVCMLRRPCKYDDDPQHGDATLALVDVAKHRNGPTGEVDLNFEDEFTRFTDRSQGVDMPEGAPASAG
jgi:replicative DNA helicase